MKISKLSVILMVCFLLTGCSQMKERMHYDTPLNDNIVSSFLDTYALPDGVQVVYRTSNDGISVLDDIVDNSSIRRNYSFTHYLNRAALTGRLDGVWYSGIASSDYVLYFYGEDMDDVYNTMGTYLSHAELQTTEGEEV